MSKENGAKVVMLLSGGLDSTVAMGVALRRGAAEVHPITFDYGQRHLRELEHAKSVVSRYKEMYPERVRDLRVIRIEGLQLDSALTSDVSVPTDRDESTMAESIPVTYVPARNSIFLSVAMAFAESLGCEQVWVGFNAVDYSGYPDCRPEFVEAMQKALGLGTKRGVEGDPVRIEAPIILLTKVEIVQTGLAAGAPMELSWSCYAGGEKPCGVCDSCVIRAKAFATVGISDPAQKETV